MIATKEQQEELKTLVTPIPVEVEGMKKKLPDNIICESCGKLLRHNKLYCPLFRKVRGYKKWDTCVCMIHTCYDVKAVKE